MSLEADIQGSKTGRSPGASAQTLTKTLSWKSEGTQSHLHRLISTHRISTLYPTHQARQSLLKIKWGAGGQ